MVELENNREFKKSNILIEGVILFPRKFNQPIITNAIACLKINGKEK